MRNLPIKITRERLILVILAAIALGLRVWNLPGSLHFLGDQGRDALIVAKIFQEGDLVFIGPVTSVGNMYLGPFYYYFMLPFLWLSYPSPLGPAFAMAIFGVATVLGLYLWGRKLVGERAGLIAGLLMTFSVVAISLSRFSWNPNLAPFVSLAMMYATYLAWQKNPKYWLLVGLLFAILLQLHYVTILAGAAAVVIWLISFGQRFRSKKLQPLVMPTIGALAILVISFVPLLLFDFKHDWTNFKALGSLLTSDQNFTQAEQRLGGLETVIRETHGRAMHVLFEFTIGKQRQLNSLLLLITILLTGLFVYRDHKKHQPQAGVIVVIVWLLVGVLGLSFYQHSVFDHYIAYLFPATFLLFGYVFDQLIKLHKLNLIIFVGFLVFYLRYNVGQYSFQPSGPTINQLSEAAAAIHARIDAGENYTLILLSSSKDLYGMNYRYYLRTIPDKSPLSPEEHARAKKLVIIDEERVAEDPLALPIYEIVTFGPSQSLTKFQLSNGTEVMILEKRGQSAEGEV